MDSWLLWLVLLNCVLCVVYIWPNDWSLVKEREKPNKYRDDDGGSYDTTYSEEYTADEILPVEFLTINIPRSKQ